MATKRILAIDGGGIRGLIPALALVKVEELTGKRIAELFDVIAGTSTGGILAAGLCVPVAPDSSTPKYAASELVELYQLHGKEIFSASLARKVASLVYGAEYSPRNLEARLQEKLGTTMLSEAVTELLITSYDMTLGEAWFFRRSVARARDDHNFPLWQIARATSAAPTYFPPFQLLKAPDATLVDGGVFANNPTVCAWVDERENLEAGGDVMVLSLGTGSVPHPITFDRSRRWGKVFWAQPAIGAFLDGQSDTADFQIKQLVNSTYYLRLQAMTLGAQHEKMDDASDANLQALADAAGQMLEAQAQPLAEFCRHLVGTTEREPTAV